MKYVSLDLAMNYIMNNMTIYHKIKNSFLKTNANFADEFKQLYKTKKIEDMERYVHTIKGVSLNLGAKPLYDSCVDALDKLRKNEWDADVLKKFYKIFKETYKELDRLKND